MNVKVSVIIPTYEPHHKYVQEAIASVDYDEAEIIVVNDSLTPLTAEGVTIINRTEPESWGTGKARNLGAKVANGVCLLWLDSDDRLIPGAIKLLWDAWVVSVSEGNPGGNIVYGDLIRSDNNYYWQVKDQYCGTDLRQSGLITSNRPYCCLISKQNHDLVDGYDELMPTWEDIDYEKKTTVAGLCETHLNAAIYWYRWDSGERRRISEGNEMRDAVKTHMYNKYRDYHEGRKTLANCRTCGDQPVNPHKQHPINDFENKNIPLAASNEVQYLVYIGGEATRNIPVPNMEATYRWGSDRRHSKKRIVDHFNLQPDEINRAHATELLKMRIHNRDQFKFQTEFVVGEVARPTPKPVVPQATPEQIQNADLTPFFEEDSITNYSIAEIKAKMAESEIPRSQLQLWLEEELKRGKESRITMVRELRNAVG